MKLQRIGVATCLAAVATALLAGAAASTSAAPSWVNTGPEGGRFAGWDQHVMIHPKQPSVVYAYSWYGLFRSTDGTASWQRRSAPRYLQAVAVDPQDPQTLHAIGDTGLFTSRNGGASWSPLCGRVLCGPETELESLLVLAVSPSSPRTIYVVSNGKLGLWRSTDAGATWERTGEVGAASDQPLALLVDPVQADTIYVWIFKGLFRSEDGGSTWARADAGLPIGKLSSVAGHPTRSGVLYAGSERGDVFRSLDAGRTWTAVARRLAGDVAAIAVGPDGAVYAGMSPPYRKDGVEIGGGTVYRSADGRAPWRAGSDGLSGWHVSALVAHPRTPGRILAATEHGIFLTRDGGGTWAEKITGLAASSPTGLVVDPADPASVFTTVERGVAVSRDGGRTWGDSLDIRSERADVGSLVAVPAAPGVLYAVKRSHAAPKPRSILLTSRDAGRTWVEVETLPGPTGYRGAPWAAIVADPSSATTLYLVSRGIFRSVDAGRTWKRIYSPVGKPPADALAVDPFDSKVLYALMRGRLRTSENGGRTWRQLPGIPQAGIWQFALDPHRRGTVYAVTGGWVNVVYVSKDRGGTWSKLGKPPIIALALLVDPVRRGVVYVGSERSVYVKRSGTATWQRVGPAGYVRWLATDANGRRLYAGIEGGGVAATRLPLRAAEMRRSGVSSRSSAKPGVRAASPTARLIAFTRADGVYVMNADGSGVRPLWRGFAGVTDVAWSPDGSKLAFGTWGGRVRVMNADGSGVVHIAKVIASSLTWSADGRRIAFTWRHGSNIPDIWVMNADGSNMHRLEQTPGPEQTPEPWDSNVDWSPAGGRLAFDSGGYVPSILVIRTDGSGLRTIPVCSHQPDWSPDGRKIVFVGCGHEIWVMNASGRSRERLTPYVGEAHPAWSPDGRKIAFVRNGEIYVMNANGTGARSLTVAGRSPAWQPVTSAEG